MSTISAALAKAHRRDCSRLRRMPKAGGRAAKGTIVARVNVGLEADEWHWICNLADGTDCTVSEVVREILRGALERCLREGEECS